MVTDGIYLEYGNLDYVLFDRAMNLAWCMLFLGFCLGGGFELICEIIKCFISKFKKDGVENG